MISLINFFFSLIFSLSRFQAHRRVELYWQSAELSTFRANLVYKSSSNLFGLADDDICYFCHCLLALFDDLARFTFIIKIKTKIKILKIITRMKRIALKQHIFKTYYRLVAVCAYSKNEKKNHPIKNSNRSSEGRHNHYHSTIIPPQ